MTSATRGAGRDIPRWGWQEDAACRDGDLQLFFGADGELKRERLAREARAKAVCAGCPVRDACLRQALTVPERFGVWGGLGEEERQVLRRTGDRWDVA